VPYTSTHEVSCHWVQSVTGCGSQRRHVVVTTYALKGVWCSMKTTLIVHVYVSHQSQIQFEDEDHAVCMSFC